MGKDEHEITGGRGRRIQQRAARGSKRAKPKRRSFTLKRRLDFLSHFAASCNAAAAARAVGISENCVYRWRRTDPQFGAGWAEALAQGYARLEAELVRTANRALTIRANKAAAVRITGMDAKTALAVLEAYRRSGGRAPGGVWPHPYDMDEVRARLEAKLRAIGAIGARLAPIEGVAAVPPPVDDGADDKSDDDHRDDDGVDDDSGATPSGRE